VAVPGFLEQVPLLLVLSGGFITLLSPCGYILLPSYVMYFLGGEVKMKGAIRGGLTTVLGIFTILGAAGFAAALASQWLQSVVPHLTLVAGVIMILLGLSKVLEDRIGALDFGSSLGGKIKPTGFFTLGVVYALTAAGCTFPIFFSVILYASLVPGIGTLITMATYAIGVALPVMVTSIFAAKFNQVVTEKIANIAPKIQKASGYILLVAGSYLIYYYYFVYLTA
jgi:cytochrome c biogenesis protein CcdA